jgi:hypothetical protein
MGSKKNLMYVAIFIAGVYAGKKVAVFNKLPGM